MFGLSRFALTKNNKSITEITLSANNTIEQIQPVISKIDGMADELDPTVTAARTYAEG